MLQSRRLQRQSFAVFQLFDVATHPRTAVAVLALSAKKSDCSQARQRPHPAVAVILAVLRLKSPAQLRGLLQLRALVRQSAISPTPPAITCAFVTGLNTCIGA